jgi:hypothetical protein
MERARAEWDRIERTLTQLGFSSVELDPEGYRRGGLLALAPQLPD